MLLTRAPRSSQNTRVASFFETNSSSSSSSGTSSGTSSDSSSSSSSDDDEQPPKLLRNGGGAVYRHTRRLHQKGQFMRDGLPRLMPRARDLHCGVGARVSNAEAATALDSYRAISLSQLPSGRALYLDAGYGVSRRDAMFSVAITGELPGINVALAANASVPPSIELLEQALKLQALPLFKGVDTSSSSLSDMQTAMHVCGKYLFNNHSLTQLHLLFRRAALLDKTVTRTSESTGSIERLLHALTSEIQVHQVSNATFEQILWTEVYRLRLVWTMALSAAMARDALLANASHKSNTRKKTALLAARAHEVSSRKTMQAWLGRVPNALNRFANGFPSLNSRPLMSNKSLTNTVIDAEKKLDEIDRERGELVVMPAAWRNALLSSQEQAEQQARKVDPVTSDRLFQSVPPVLPQYPQNIIPTNVVVDAVDLLVAHSIAGLVGHLSDGQIETFPSHVTVLAHLERFMPAGAYLPSSLSRIVDGVRVLGKYAKKHGSKCHLIVMLPGGFSLWDQAQRVMRDELKDLQPKDRNAPLNRVVATVESSAVALVNPLLVFSKTHTAEELGDESYAPWETIELEHIAAAFVNQLSVRTTSANNHYGEEMTTTAVRSLRYVRYTPPRRIKNTKAVSKWLEHTFPGLETTSATNKEIQLKRV